MAGNLRAVAVADSQKTTPKPKMVKVTITEVNRLLGTDYTAEKVAETLTNVGFVIQLEDGLISATIPYWRTDIQIKEDLIEEVGRLTGYDNILPVLPLHGTAEPNRMLKLKKQVREILSALGGNEVLTYTFIHGDLMAKVGQEAENSYRIVNSISPDLQYVRQQIVPSLLVKAYDNLKAGYERFVLFEMNQVFLKSDGLDDEGVPIANMNLGVVVANKNGKAQYYLAKRYLEEMMRRLAGELRLEALTATEKCEGYYEPKRSARIVVNEEPVGIIGEITEAARRKLKLPTGVAGVEIDLLTILEHLGSRQKKLQFSQFPSVERDLTFRVKTEVNYERLLENMRATLEKTGMRFEIRPASIYQAEGDTATKNISFKMKLTSLEKTLDTGEISAIIERIVKNAEKVGAEAV